MDREGESQRQEWVSCYAHPNISSGFILDEWVWIKYLEKGYPMKSKIVFFVLVSLILAGCQDKPGWFVLSKSDVAAGTYHTRHAEIFGKYAPGYNKYILQGIDKVQATALEGGGYFTGIKAVPTESPIGYRLKLGKRALLDPPRSTSYCSGSSYAAFIEGLNRIFSDSLNKLDSVRFEALRMQEPDGGRREDHVKFWGWWNADGFGSHFALVQYAKMGEVIAPKDARPGDFMNISWKSGLGHSVVFLGWYVSKDGTKNVVYWSSQKSTNGLGDQIVPISRIREVMVVRLTKPQNLFSYDIGTAADTEVKGFPINW